MSSSRKIRFLQLVVTRVLTQMAPLKPLGPDGFAACFYQKNWAIIGDEACIMFRDFSTLAS
jgi:hypothetical protein